MFSVGPSPRPAVIFTGSEVRDMSQGMEAVSAMRAHFRRSWFVYAGLLLPALASAVANGVRVALLTYALVIIAGWLVILVSTLYDRLRDDRFERVEPTGFLEKLVDRWIVPFRARALARNRAAWERDAPQRRAAAEAHRRAQPATLGNINPEFARWWMAEASKTRSPEQVQRALAEINADIQKESTTVGEVEDKAQTMMEELERKSLPKDAS